MKTILIRTLFFVFTIFVCSIHAQKAGETYYIESVHNNKFIDLTTANRETPPSLRKFSSKKAQQFKLIDAGDGYFYIKSEMGNIGLHVLHANKNPKAVVTPWEIVDYDNLKWRFIDAGNGYHYIQSKLGNYLNHVDYKNIPMVWMWSFDGKNTQKWKLKPLLGAVKNNIQVFKPKENFGERCITTAEDHLKGTNRNIGGEADGRVNMKFELVNNSIRATATVKINRDFVSATWSKIIFRGGDKEIEGFDIGYNESRTPIFKTFDTQSNVFRLPAGGADVFDCHKGTIKDVKTNYGLIRMVGDTGGTDITDNYDCSCDAKLVDIVFNWIAVKYKDNSNIKCSNAAYDTTKPTFEFTIYNNNGFEYTFTEKDAFNPNNFEVKLKPNTNYRYKLTINDKHSGLNKIRFSAPNNNLQMSSNATAGAWKFNNNSTTQYYRWEGNKNTPNCKKSLLGILNFSKGNIDERNEIFILNVTDFKGNSLNKQVHVTVPNSLRKEKVKYFFDYK